MKNKIPHILSEMSDKGIALFFDDKSNHIERAKFVDSVFKKFKPNTAFLYTTPYDVSGVIVFSNNKSSTRVQLDLTDHAFWIGINAFEYIEECRGIGASIAVNYRYVKKEQILKYDCSPYINRENNSKTLPFDIYSNKLLFLIPCIISFEKTVALIFKRLRAYVWVKHRASI